MEKIKKIISYFPHIFSLLIITEIVWANFALLNYPLRNWFHDYSLSPHGTPLLLYLLFTFSLLVSLYFLFFRAYSSLENEKQKKLFPYLIFFFFLFQITLAFIKPVASGDIYNYIYTTKVFTLHHQNPYLIPPATFPDPLKKLIFPPWTKFTLNYGPLWLLFSSLPTLLFPHNIRLGCFAFQLLAILFNSASAWLIFKILKIIKPNYKFLGTSLYFFNPLILWETANNGHNDIIMVFFILLSFYFLLKEKYSLSYIWLWASFFVKYISLIIIPFWFIFSLEKQKRKNYLKFILKISGLTFIIFSVIGVLFYFKINIFHSIREQYKYFSPILSGLLPVFLLFIFPKNILYIRITSSLTFILINLFLYLSFWLKKEKNLALLSWYGSIAFLLYLIIASFWNMEWYLLWILPGIIISGKEKLNFLLTLGGLLSYIFPPLVIMLIWSAVIPFYSFLKKYAFPKNSPYSSCL